MRREHIHNAVSDVSSEDSIDSRKMRIRHHMNGNLPSGEIKGEFNFGVQI